MNYNISEMLTIYNKSFPRLQTDEETFAECLMLDQGSRVFEYRMKGALAGYSVVNDDCILLLCVGPAYRKQGIGSQLLHISEEHISRSFDVIHLGSSGNTYLLCGVPMDPDCASHEFFQKHGYTEKWISCDMIIDLTSYSRKPELDNKDSDIIIRPRSNDADEIVKTIQCAEIIDGWGDCYKAAADVIVAETKGEIIGLVIVERDSCIFTKSLKGAGTLACLGVLEAYRKHGVGMKLCQEALCRLKESGCKTCHIGYTWLDWWYGKLGARKYMSYWMGEKKIER
jgi:GNAT superfamily N-acetyltransferase